MSQFKVQTFLFWFTATFLLSCTAKLSSDARPKRNVDDVKADPSMDSPTDSNSSTNDDQISSSEDPAGSSSSPNSSEPDSGTPSTLPPEVNATITTTSTEALMSSILFDGNTLKASYQAGGIPPSDCSSGTVIPAASLTSSPHIINGLSAETTYSFRICDARITALLSDRTFTVATLKSASFGELYTGNSNWGDYVRNDGGDFKSATNTACDGTETGSHFEELCLHGGELRKITISSLGTSCSTNTARDHLGVFDWICDDSSGTHLDFFSTGLKKDSRIAELINGISLKPQWVIISDGAADVASTSISPWMTNPIVPIPPGNADLSAAGSIYVLESDRTDDVHNITADKVTVTTLGNVTLTSSGTEAIKSTGQKFLWIEGNYAEGSSETIELNSVGYSVVHQADFDSSTTGLGVNISDTNYMLLRALTAYDATSVTAAAVYVSGLGSGTSFIKMEDVVARNSQKGILIASGGSQIHLDNVSALANADVGIQAVGTGGVRITNSLASNNSVGIILNNAYHILDNLVIANNSSHGIRTDSVNNCIFSNLTVVNNSGTGVYLWTSSANSLQNITSVNNENNIYAWKGIVNTFVNVVTNNSSLKGMRLENSSLANYTFSQVLLGDEYNIMSSAHDVSFKDNLLLTPTTTCTHASPGANPGLADTTCANTGTSTSNQVSGVDISNSYVGIVSADTTNSSHDNGTKLLDSIFDIRFDNPYRAWGRSDSAPFSATNRKACLTGETCQIWDWRLRSTDTSLRNKTNDGSSANASFSAGIVCPAAIHGNKAITDSMSTPNTFLLNAKEIMGDGIGDDDTFCESNESCIYSPNFGSYQGEGDYLSNGTCTFQNGTVTNVSMYAYPTNGI